MINFKSDEIEPYVGFWRSDLYSIQFVCYLYSLHAFQMVTKISRMEKLDLVSEWFHLKLHLLLYVIDTRFPPVSCYITTSLSCRFVIKFYLESRQINFTYKFYFWIVNKKYICWNLEKASELWCVRS